MTVLYADLYSTGESEYIAISLPYPLCFYAVYIFTSHSNHMSCVMASMQDLSVVNLGIF